MVTRLFVRTYRSQTKVARDAPSFEDAAFRVLSPLYRASRSLSPRATRLGSRTPPPALEHAAMPGRACPPHRARRRRAEPRPFRARGPRPSPPSSPWPLRIANGDPGPRIVQRGRGVEAVRAENLRAHAPASAAGEAASSTEPKNASNASGSRRATRTRCSNSVAGRSQRG